MTRKRYFAALALLLLGLLVLTTAWAAPKLLTDTRGTYRPLGENNWVPLKVHAGKPLLLVFWASWCAPCVGEIPSLNALYDKFQHSDLKIVAVNLDSTNDEGVRRIIQRHRIRYPVAQPSDDLVQEYAVNAIPASYLYDKNGTLVAEWIGPPAPEELERNVQTAIHGVPPPPTTPSPVNEKVGINP